MKAEAARTIEPKGILLTVILGMLWLRIARGQVPTRT